MFSGKVEVCVWVGVDCVSEKDWEMSEGSAWTNLFNIVLGGLTALCLMRIPLEQMGLNEGVAEVGCGGGGIGLPSTEKDNNFSMTIK